jgi:hypothetical protein
MSTSSQDLKKKLNAVSRRYGRTVKSWRVCRGVPRMQLDGTGSFVAFAPNAKLIQVLPDHHFHCGICDRSGNAIEFPACANADKCGRHICGLCAAKTNSTTCKACAAEVKDDQEIKTTPIATWTTERATVHLDRAKLRNLAKSNDPVIIPIRVSTGMKIFVRVSARPSGSDQFEATAVFTMAAEHGQVYCKDLTPFNGKTFYVGVYLNPHADFEHRLDMTTDFKPSIQWFVPEDDDVARGEYHVPSELWLYVDVAIKKQ